MIDEPAVQATPTPALWESLPPPPVTATSHIVRNILIIIGIVVLLITIGGAYLVAARATTGPKLDAANVVLNDVDQHHKDVSSKIGAVFDSVSGLKGSDFDATKAKTAIDQTNTQVLALEASDTTDVAKARVADAKVQDRSVLTALSSAALDRSHRRLSAYRSALVIELGELDSIQQQLAIVGDLMTTLVQLKALSDDLAATNFSAGEKDYAAPSSTLDKVIAAAASHPDTPSKFKEFLTIFRSELNHIKGIVDGARDRSLVEIQAADSALKADLDALGKFDSAAMQQQYTDLGTRYDAKVQAELNKAK